jgi:hypothetical protein
MKTDRVRLASPASPTATRSGRYRTGAACYRPAVADRYHSPAVTDHCHLPGVTDGYHRAAVMDGCRRPAVMDAARIHRRFPACPVAKDRADLGAYSAAEVARAAAAETAEGEAGASDAVVEREDAAAAADGAATHCAVRTRVARHSSAPNNPPR